MNTTHDDNATTWRDLVDQLTPQQIAEMEYCERERIPPDLTSPQHQLNCARSLAKHNFIQALCDHRHHHGAGHNHDNGHGHSHGGRGGKIGAALREVVRPA